MRPSFFWTDNKSLIFKWLAGSLFTLSDGKSCKIGAPVASENSDVRLDESAICSMVTIHCKPNGGHRGH